MANPALYVTSAGVLTTVSAGNTAVFLDASGGLTTVNTGDVVYWGASDSPGRCGWCGGLTAVSTYELFPFTSLFPSTTLFPS